MSVGRITRDRLGMLDSMETYLSCDDDPFDCLSCALPKAAYDENLRTLSDGLPDQVNIGKKFRVVLEGSGVGVYYSHRAGTKTLLKKTSRLVLDVPADSPKQAKRYQAQIVAALRSA